MDFSLTDDQQAMRDTLHRFLSENPAPDWKSLCDMGVMAALMPSERGGIGGAGRDIALVFEELGRACIASPALACVMASMIDGSEDALMAGHIIAPAFYEQAGRYDHNWCCTQADSLDNTDDTIVLHGEKSGVPHAGSAHGFVVSAMLSDQLGVFHVSADAAGLVLQAVSTLDDGETGTISLSGVEVSDKAARTGIDRAVAAGLLAAGSEALGLMDAMRDMTIAYLKQRKQFDKTLAGFQVIQHRLADMAMAIEQVRSSVINAAAAFDAGGGALTAELHALKHQTGEVGRLVCEESIQLHGGIGMTQDYALGSYARRLLLLDHHLGDSDWHLSRFMEIIQAEAAA